MRIASTVHQVLHVLAVALALAVVSGGCLGDSDSKEPPCPQCVSDESVGMALSAIWGIPPKPTGKTPDDGVDVDIDLPLATVLQEMGVVVK